MAKLNRIPRNSHRRHSDTEPERGPFHDGRPLIVVFGSSAAKRGEELYEQGYRMGRLLADGGFNVMTGGHTGLMEAASRGAYDGGARVVGVILKRFEEKPNRYVTKVISSSNFYSRFRWLIDRADGYVALHGGMGTLAEVSFAWQELALGMLPGRPLVLIGGAWKTIVGCWMENLITAADRYRVLTSVDTPEEAHAFLSRFFARTRPGIRRR